MVKLKQVVILNIELIQYKNTTDNLPSHFKGYTDINPHLLSEHGHQIILDKIKSGEILTMINMWNMKITIMYILLIPMIMIIKNLILYLIFFEQL